MKYPPLQEPCKSCIYKCGRVAEPSFICDKTCIYAMNPIQEIKKILGIQEMIKIDK